jgi:hypothetical protein
MNILKQYIKSLIINESSYNISPSDEANAIFGNANSTAKNIYFQLIELDNFFAKFTQKYKNANDFIKNPPPQKMLNILIDVLSANYGAKSYEDSIKILYETLKNIISKKEIMYVYRIYLSLITDHNSIGQGASRFVYNIGNDFVLKISLDNIKNEPFFGNQNRFESNPELQKILTPFVPIVYTKSKNSPSELMRNKDGVHWIIVEKCTGISMFPDAQIEWLKNAKITSYNPEKDQTYVNDYIMRWINLLYDHISQNTSTEKLSKYQDVTAVNKDVNIYKIESLPDDKKKEIYDFSIDKLSILEKKLIEAHQKSIFNIRDINSRNVGYGSDGRPVILDTGFLAKLKN